MQTYDQHYIGGQWVTSSSSETFDLFNPANEQPYGRVSLGSVGDADAATKAASIAAPCMAAITQAERMLWLHALLPVFERYMPALMDAVQMSLGAPRQLCEGLQVRSGLMQLHAWSQTLASFEFEQKRGRHRVWQKPVGVSLCITSWNWPVNGSLGVLLPALAAGCPIVWKPSEHATATAVLLAQVMHEAGLPAGAFNMVLGNGRDVGQHLVTHPSVAMVSFTGSGTTGRHIGALAASQCKRVVLELSGKSPFIVLPGTDITAAVKACTVGLMRNSGQTCNAPSRLLVPQDLLPQAEAVATAVVQAIEVGNPANPVTQMGPLGNQDQFNNVQAFLTQALEEGARVVTGGLGRPEGLTTGWYARPTILSGLKPNSHAVQEEAFGPVLALQGYTDIDDAVRLANHTPYGLSAYVMGPDVETSLAVAGRLEASMVHINGAEIDLGMPFGGFKQSGVGRKFGPEGLKAYLEPQSILLPA